MAYYSSASDEEDYSDVSSEVSGSTSDDEDAYDIRLNPVWDNYRLFFENYGYHLDTCRDVKLFFLRYWESRNIEAAILTSPGYCRALRGDENELCKDAGLPERLFRGKRTSDGTHIVVKAVHKHSRELEVIRELSTPPMRDLPMNHCIPVLDLLEPPNDNIAFIVMEEWSSQLVSDVYTTRTIPLFLDALTQVTEHVAFMHSHHMVHLDLSLRNILTDFEGRYAFIDFECSRKFDAPAPGCPPLYIKPFRTAEVPPECERMEKTNPFKADIWALGMLFRNACHATGHKVPRLWELTIPMLDPCIEQRPSADVVLKGLNHIRATLNYVL